MTRLNICLLTCGTPPPGYEKLDGDYPHMFAQLFASYAPNVNLVPFNVQEQDYPADDAEFDGYLSSGSAASVYDSEPWINQFEEYVRTLYATGRKHVGICFGHQMIARALGGHVERSNQGWGVGVKTTRIVSQQSWMEPALTSYDLLVSHQDQVTSLPPGSQQLAANDYCPMSMFSIGHLALGIQAHPEFNARYAKPLMLSRKDRIGQQTLERALPTMEMSIQNREIAVWIENFFREIPQS